MPSGTASIGFVPVHPHACGGYSSSSTKCVIPNGSPPRMWGIWYIAGSSTGNRRFTPTHVGDIAGKSDRYGLHAVHPHACGGYALPDGKYVQFNRFTPTHVGDMYCIAPSGIPIFGSPPRMWGICAVSGIEHYAVHGSPPRMWGIW